MNFENLEQLLYSDLLSLVIPDQRELSVIIPSYIEILKMKSETLSRSVNGINVSIAYVGIGTPYAVCFIDTNTNSYIFKLSIDCMVLSIYGHHFSFISMKSFTDDERPSFKWVEKLDIKFQDNIIYNYIKHLTKPEILIETLLDKICKALKSGNISKILDVLKSYGKYQETLLSLLEQEIFDPFEITNTENNQIKNSREIDEENLVSIVLHIINCETNLKHHHLSQENSTIPSI